MPADKLCYCLRPSLHMQQPWFSLGASKARRKEMAQNEGIYRQLQEHFDRQAVGFPATRSGADVALLRQIFTPEEAEMALRLSYRPAPLESIAAGASETLKAILGFIEKNYKPAAFYLSRSTIAIYK